MKITKGVKDPLSQQANEAVRISGRKKSELKLVLYFYINPDPTIEVNCYDIFPPIQPWPIDLYSPNSPLQPLASIVAANCFITIFLFYIQ
jgi:hypothetical protein